jgi:hypothetical protein
MKLNGPLKVSVSLSHGFNPSWVTDGGLKFNDAFIDRLHEKEEFFRERIILQINEIAGDAWAIHFSEEPTQSPSYLVDITANDKLISMIVRIVANAFPEISLDFWKPSPYVHLGKRQAAVVD